MMFKKMGFCILLLLFVVIATQAQTSIYEFKVRKLNGDIFDFSSLKGKKVMIVNTASKCGLTKQYEALQEIYKKYGGDKFVIIAFPANNFMNQEPGTAEEIESFCRVNYGVTFPVMEKISVKGKDMAPVYQWLTQKKMNGFDDSEVKWNFQKYLIDEQGKLVKVIAPTKSPDDNEIISWITQ